MPIGAAVGSIAGGLIQSSSARRASNAQTQAAAADREMQREFYHQTRDDLAPYRNAGTNALAPLMYDLGLLSEAPTIGATPLEVTAHSRTIPVGDNYRPSVQDLFRRGGGEAADDIFNPEGRTTTEEGWMVGGQFFADRGEADAYAMANGTGGAQYGGFTESPGYQYRLNQGLDAVEASAASRGMLRSGSTLNALNQTAQDYATNEYGAHINRLMGAAGMGQQAASQQVAANQNAAANMSNTYAAQGNAQAAGAIAQGNAMSGTLNNLAGLWGYQNAQGWGWS